MTRVSALPFMLGIAGALVLFIAWLPLAVRESRRPYRWPAPRPPRPARREVPTAPVADLRPKPAPAVAMPTLEPRRHHAPEPRVALIVAAFTVWSLWSLRNRADHF